jgi:hypothetical protein
VSDQAYIGDFNKFKPESGITHLAVKQPVRDFQLDWRRYNLVSNYFAEYGSYLFEQKDRAENLISTVLYELCEAMAHYAERNSSILIKLVTVEETILFELAAFSPPELRAPLEETVRIINREDLASTYLSMLSSEKPGDAGKTHFGLILIAHDYNADMALGVNAKNNATTLRVAVANEEISS